MVVDCVGCGSEREAGRFNNLVEGRKLESKSVHQP